MLSQIFFLCIAEVWNAYSILQPGAPMGLYRLLDIFWPVSNLFLFITGITFIVANRLQDWKG